MKINHLIQPYCFVIVIVGLIYFSSIISIECATFPLHNTLNDTTPYLTNYNRTFSLTNNKTIQAESQIQNRRSKLHDVDFQQLQDDLVFGDDDNESKVLVRNKKKRQRSNTKTTQITTTNNIAQIEPSVFSNLSKTTSLSSKAANGRSWPNTEINPNITSSLSNVESLLGIGEGLIPIAVAIRIAAGAIWAKLIIAALIAWWWWGSGEKKYNDEDYGESPVYGPPKPAYGPPVYGAPTTQSYGRQLYNSIDFHKLTDRVWRAVDFFETYYNSSNGTDVVGNKSGRNLKNAKIANVEPIADDKKNS